VAGRAKGRSAGQMVGGAVAALILVGGGIYAWFDFSHASKKEAARAAEWDIAGPPCPEMTAADFAKTGYRLRNDFAYEGVQFRMAAGHADCDLKGYNTLTRTGGAPACQFTSPNALSVRTDKGEQFFVPGVGKPATVTVEGGRARCVAASNFKLNG